MRHNIALCFCVLCCSPTPVTLAEVVVSTFPKKDLPARQPSSRPQHSTAAVKRPPPPPTAEDILKQIRACRPLFREAMQPANRPAPGNQVKLDFIPASDRQERTARGYSRLTAPEGTYGVEGHGTPGQMTCRNGDALSAKELSAWIKNDARYRPGMTVYLFACETGRGARSFAQILADQLQANVVAPTEKLWVHRDGSYSVAAGRLDRFMNFFTKGEERMNPDRRGVMKSFRPAAAQPPPRATKPVRMSAGLTASSRLQGKLR